MLKQELPAKTDDNFDAKDNFLSFTNSVNDNVGEVASIKLEREGSEDKDNDCSHGQTVNVQCNNPLDDSPPLQLDEGKDSQINQNSISNFKCTVCQSLFACIEDLNSHSEIFGHRGEQYTCKDCPDKNFEKLNQLRTHRKVKHFVSKECEVCKLLCTTYHQYQWHNVKHFGKVFACSQCPKKFVKRGKLDEHMNFHTGETPYRCEKCNIGFRYKRSYINHNTRRHLMVDDDENGEDESKNLKFPCDFCEKAFTKRRSLAAHIRCCHTKTARNKCEECKKCFLNFQKLESHLISVHGKKSPYQCTQCDRRPFNSKGDLTRHYKIRHGPNSRENISMKYMQSISSDNNKEEYSMDKVTDNDAESNSNSDYSPQLKSEEPHSNDDFNVEDNEQDSVFLPRVTEQDMKILVEDFKFEMETDSENHQDASSSSFQSSQAKNSISSPKSTENMMGCSKSSLDADCDPRRKHKCQFCGMGFRAKYRVSEHERIHTGEKPYECATCKKHFTTRKNLKDHDKLHTNAYSLFCEICGKGARDAAYLRHHKKTHSEDKPFKCPVCNKGFTAAHTVTEHLRLHTGERPFQCDICNRYFTTSSALKKHRMRNHEAKKKYECQICSDTFSRKMQFNKHMVLVHQKSVIF